MEIRNQTRIMHTNTISQSFANRSGTCKLETASKILDLANKYGNDPVAFLRAYRNDANISRTDRESFGYADNSMFKTSDRVAHDIAARASAIVLARSTQENDLQKTFSAQELNAALESEGDNLTSTENVSIKAGNLLCKKIESNSVESLGKITLHGFTFSGKNISVPENITLRNCTAIDKSVINFSKGKLIAEGDGTELFANGADAMATALNGGRVTALNGGKATALRGGEAIALNGGKATVLNGGAAIARDGGEATVLGDGKAIALDGGRVTVFVDGKATALKGGVAIAKGGVAIALNGGEATAEDGGEATVLGGGKATALKGGKVFAKDGGKAIVKDGGIAIVRKGGLATVLCGGSATAKDGGEVILLKGSRAIDNGGKIMAQKDNGKLIVLKGGHSLPNGIKGKLITYNGSKDEAEILELLNKSYALELFADSEVIKEDDETLKLLNNHEDESLLNNQFQELSKKDNWELPDNGEVVKEGISQSYSFSMRLPQTYV